MNKNDKNKAFKREFKNLKKDGIKNNTLFNRKSFVKKEEYKSNSQIKEPNQDNKKFRLKTARPINPFKLSSSRNYNDYKQILQELTDINTSKINWAMKLRKDQLMNLMSERDQKDLNKKKLRNISSAKPGTKGLVLTSNFIEPRFYMDDLEKYRKKINPKKRPLSSILNPNFNNVKHLFTNKINLQSKEFASSLRCYTTKKSKAEKIKWNNFFTNDYKNRDNAYYSSFLLPKTDEGKKNLKKLEKKIYKPYQIAYKDIVLGSDTIKQKVLTPKRDFTYSGIGSYLDLGNYRTNYGVKNTSLNERILKTESNSQCLFELGLRNYPKIKTKA